MKSKKEIQRKLGDGKIEQWNFQNVQLGKNILPELVNTLTDDEKLRKDLLRYHKELLDRRFSVKIDLLTENGQIKTTINGHAFNPARLEEFENNIMYMIQSIGYVTKERIDSLYQDKEPMFENIQVKSNLDKQDDDITGIVYKVEFA